MKKFLLFAIAFNLIGFLSAPAQIKQSIIKGKLFIIGGGNRSPELMKTLAATAAFGAKDYAVVLPMSSEEPDTSFYYFKQDFTPVCATPLVSFNFTKDKVNDSQWLDSLEHARLIFITGGDQERFMKVVLNTPVYKAIHKAYANGATIAGTSAGAAVMSQHMITGTQLTDTTYQGTFNKIQDHNIEIKEGLGLLTTAVIDQHFIIRSRYNRLLTALATYPTLACIGIDEATAIIVQNNKITVAGHSQVILFQKPKDIKITPAGLIKMKNVQLSIYTAGDVFYIDKQVK